MTTASWQVSRAATAAHHAAIRDVLTRDGCRGCAPARKEEEAYALLWFVAPGEGAASGTLDGLRVVIRSIRRHDDERPIVVMLAREQDDRTSTSQSPGRAAVEATIENIGQRIRVVHIAKVSALPRLVQAQAPRRRGQPSHALEWAIPNFLCRTQVKRKLAEHNVSLPSQLTSHSSAQLASSYARARGLQMFETFTKFAVFNLTRYRRVLYLDTDTMLTHRVDTLWRLRFDDHEAVAAALTMRGHEAASPSCTSESDHKRRRHRPYNSGVMLLRPITHLYAALIAAITDHRFAFLCSNEQTVFNLLMGAHVRCIGHSWNCYDPILLAALRPMDALAARRTGCSNEQTGSKLESSTEVSAVAMASQHPHPHILHFAVGSKPWLHLNESTRSFYMAMWSRILGEG